MSDDDYRYKRTRLNVDIPPETENLPNDSVALPSEPIDIPSESVYLPSESVDLLQEMVRYENERNRILTTIPKPADSDPAGIEIADTQLVDSDSIETGDQNDKTDICAICREEFGNTRDSTFSCTHRYHDECISFMTTTNCPLCRKDLYEELSEEIREEIADNREQHRRHQVDEETRILQERYGVGSDYETLSGIPLLVVDPSRLQNSTAVWFSILNRLARTSQVPYNYDEDDGINYDERDDYEDDSNDEDSNEEANTEEYIYAWDGSAINNRSSVRNEPHPNRRRTALISEYEEDPYDEPDPYGDSERRREPWEDYEDYTDDEDRD